MLGFCEFGEVFSGLVVVDWILDFEAELNGVSGEMWFKYEKGK